MKIQTQKPTQQHNTKERNGKQRDGKLNGKSPAWEPLERARSGEPQGLREQQGRELPPSPAAPLGSQLGVLTDVLT